MNLCEELTMKSNGIEAKRKEVRDEIKNDFAEYISSGKLEEYLRDKIGENEIIHRGFVMRVWYSTYNNFEPAGFRCGGYLWTPPGVDRYNSNKYKGVRLADIHEDVCCMMSHLLHRGLSDLGFSSVKSSGAKANPYYTNTITVEW